MTCLLHALLREVGLQVPPGLANPDVRLVSCDSRRLGAGSVFVGLPGTQADGGRFWRQALQGRFGLEVPLLAQNLPAGERLLPRVPPRLAGEQLQRWLKLQGVQME